MNTGCWAQSKSRATCGKMEIMIFLVVFVRKIEISGFLKTSVFYVFVVDIFTVFYFTQFLSLIVTKHKPFWKMQQKKQKPLFEEG